MERNPNPRALGDNDSFSEVTEDPIGSGTPVDRVISALGQRGCLDLGSKIDWSACSDLPLAGGGFCDVFRCAMSDGTKIAIKSLRLYDKPGQDADREKTRVLKRAVRELYHWSKLNHRNVLPLMGLAVFKGQMSMISEWVENGNLMAFVECNPNADRIGLCIDVCRGLRYIHASGMASEPANVMVSSNGRAMIADFGNSQLRDITLKFSNTTGSNFSTRWAAPELLRGEEVQDLSKPADVYAFGMTVLEALTGKVPYHELNERRVWAVVLMDRRTPTRPTDMSDEIWEILQDCWKWDQLERPEVRSVMRRLKHLYSRTPRSTTIKFEGAEMEQQRMVKTGENHTPGGPHHILEGNNKDHDGHGNRARRAPTPEGIVPPPKRMRQAQVPNIPAQSNEVHADREAGQTAEFKPPETNRTHVTHEPPGAVAALPPANNIQAPISRTPSLDDGPRRIYVSGITREANATNLQEFFNRSMAEVNASTGGDDPVAHIQIIHEKNYAFVIFRSAELATEALALDGIIFQSIPLRVRRYRPRDP